MPPAYFQNQRIRLTVPALILFFYDLVPVDQQKLQSTNTWPFPNCSLMRTVCLFIYDCYFRRLPIFFWVTRLSPSDPHPPTALSAAARLRILCSGVCILCSEVCKADDSPRQFVFSPLRGSQIRFTCQMCEGIIRAAPTSDFFLFDVSAVRCRQFPRPHPPSPARRRTPSLRNC